VTEVGPDERVRVNCGLQHPISLPAPNDRELSEGERVTVRVSSRRPVRAKLVDDSPPGYVVDACELGAAVAREDAGLAIAASRHGEVLTVERLGDLVQRRDAASDLTVAFGAPERGLPDVLGIDPEVVGRDHDSDETGFDLWLNTVPDQGSAVVRTEEALFATLAPLTLMEH
jgi:predicted SPOUT superfamily RNA methylase MTH1